MWYSTLKKVEHNSLFLNCFPSKMEQGQRRVASSGDPSQALPQSRGQQQHSWSKPHEDVLLTWWDERGTWPLRSSSHDHSHLIMKKLHTNFHRGAPTGCPTHTPQNCRGQDFPGGPVVKNPPCNGGDMGSIPGQGTKIPYATGQLRPQWRPSTAKIQKL